MFTEIVIRYFHPGFNIGIENIRTCWLLGSSPVKLITTIHQGNLFFRIPGNRKRISYRSLKKGLIKKTIILKQPLELLPF